MNLQKSPLAAFLLILIGAARLHAAPTVAYSSITYCSGATPVATDAAPVIYTTIPWWYTGMTASSPGLMGGSYPRQLIDNTSLLLHLNSNGTDSSGAGHTVNPTNASYSPTNPCVDGTGLPGAAATSWTAGYPWASGADGGLSFTGNYNYCCTSNWLDLGAGFQCYGTHGYASAAAYAVITNLGGVFYNRSFSVELWVKTTGTPANASGNNDAPILEQCQSVAPRQCLHLALRGGRPYFGFYGDDLIADGSIANGAWHHLVFTFDYPSKYQTIYVDGVKVKERPATNAYNGTTGTTYLGVSPNISAGDSFGGEMDDIRIIGKEIPGGQVATDYAGQAWYYSDGTTSGWHPYPAGWGDNWSHGSLSAKFKMSPTWNMGTITQLHKPTTNVDNAAQNADESMSYHGLSITINQDDLKLPDAPTTPMVGSSSITWDWSSYVCNTYPTNNNTTYNITTNAGGPGTPNNQPFYSPTGLTPNTLYTFSFTAIYVDNGGSGLTVGPSGASPTSSVRTLAAPPTNPPSGITATGPTSVRLTAHILPNPDDTRCAVWAKGNGAYSVVTPYNRVREGDTLYIAGLSKSAHYAFAMNCENEEGKVAAKGPDSAASFVSQPETPTQFQGSHPGGPLICPKTSINWSWNPVNQGSRDPASAGLTPYQVSTMNANGTLGPGTVCTPVGTSSCLETGLVPGTAYSRVVEAQDSGASWTGPPPPPSAVWSDTSATAGFSTTVGFTDAPSNLTAVPGNRVITWNWTPPVNVCVPFQYLPFDAVTGNPIPIPPNPSLGDLTDPLSQPNPPWTQTNDLSNAPLGTNVLYSLRLKAQDRINLAPSQLSISASAYTLADAPANLKAANVTTRSLKLQWDSTNPLYTRFEVSMSPLNDLGQPVSISTLVYISNNLTANSYTVDNLDSGSTYYFRVRAANGRAEDNYGGLLTNFAILGSTVTRPLAPALTGTGTSINTVKWEWSPNPVIGAVGYRLVNEAEVPILDNPNTAAVTFSSGPFLPNAACGAKIAAYNSNGEYGPYSPLVYTFTKANPPSAPGITGVSSNTVHLSWNPNNNASYTFYQIILATDSAFGVVAATVSVTGTSADVGGLFPAATYYAQVQAINGAQLPTDFVGAGWICTTADASVTRSSAPVSPYAVPPGIVGLWHLDEESGTQTRDASAWGNTGELTCRDIPAICSAPSSTPTFTTDAPPDLGHAVSFSGMRNSLLSIPDATQYGFGGSMTLSAWVKPATSVQTDAAGLAAKGAWNDESFSLETSAKPGGSRYLLRVRQDNGGAGVTVTVVGTSTIRTGQWDLVTGVFDRGPANQATLYINGLFASSATISWPRVTNTAPISVGNRKDGSGAYNLGFSGVIDDVRLLNSALSAAQAAELYRSYFPAQLTPPGVNSAIQLLLPPNAFPSAASIYVSDDPVSHPLRIPYSLLSQALSRPPTGQTLIPPSQSYPTLMEIVPTLDGVNYFNGDLGSSATLSLPYPDTNGDGIVDGSNPPVPASKLQLYTLDTAVLAWNALPTSVDTVAKRVSAPVAHFSVMGLFGATSYGQTMPDVRVYPVPWKWHSTDRFGGLWLTFDKLPTRGTIRILTLSGEKVIDLNFSGTDAGTKQWDGRNAAGKTVASGVYFAQINSSLDGSSRIVRFAIER